MVMATFRLGKLALPRMFSKTWGRFCRLGDCAPVTGQPEGTELLRVFRHPGVGAALAKAIPFFAADRIKPPGLAWQLLLRRSRQMTCGSGISVATERF